MYDADDANVIKPGEVIEDTEGQGSLDVVDPAADEDDVEGHGIGLNLMVASAAAAGFAAAGSTQQTQSSPSWAATTPGPCIQVPSCTVHEPSAAPVVVAMVTPGPCVQVTCRVEDVSDSTESTGGGAAAAIAMPTPHQPSGDPGSLRTEPNAVQPEDCGLPCHDGGGNA